MPVAILEPKGYVQMSCLSGQQSKTYSTKFSHFGNLKPEDLFHVCLKKW